MIAFLNFILDGFVKSKDFPSRWREGIKGNGINV
jgi:hypothetical protein